jgi:antirestriction protein
MSRVEPRIYVACLAAYNNGKLHGEWIDAAQSPEAIHEEIQAMLAQSPEPMAEEWAIHDYEGFGDLRLSEYESIEDISRVAELIEKYGEVFTAVVSHFGNLSDLDAAERAMREQYRGSYRDIAEFAEDAAKDQYGEDAFGPYADYIDWKRVGEDDENSGSIFTVETGDGMLHVFWAD